MFAALQNILPMELSISYDIGCPLAASAVRARAVSFSHLVTLTCANKMDDIAFQAGLSGSDVDLQAAELESDVDFQATGSALIRVGSSITIPSQ